jgi:hypothetical protein
MKRTIVLTSIIIIFFFEFLQAQDDIQVGSQGRGGTSSGALYDYSDPSGVNFRLQLWGYVSYPGYYIVPAGTSLNELISLAGGPTEDATLTDIRVVKMREGSQTSMLKYNYNDLMWEKNIETQINYVKLDAGDVVVVPGEPRYFVRQDIAFYLGIVTALASIAALIISIIYINN